MHLKTELYNNVLIAHVGDITLDMRTADHFKRQLLLAIQKHKEFQNIAVNMDKVKVIDSTGLGALIFALRQCRLKNGHCYLVSPTEKVQKLLKVAKLDGEFRILNSLEEIFENKLL